MDMNKGCGTVRRTDDALIAPGYAFVPWQTLEKVYSPSKALKEGTIFPELDITLCEYERGLYDGK